MKRKFPSTFESGPTFPTLVSLCQTKLSTLHWKTFLHQLCNAQRVHPNHYRILDTIIKSTARVPDTRTVEYEFQPELDRHGLQMEIDVTVEYTIEKMPFKVDIDTNCDLVTHF